MGFSSKELERRKKIGGAMRKRWRDEAYRKSQSASRKLAWKGDEKRRKAASSRAKDNWNDKEFRDRVSKSISVGAKRSYSNAKRRRENAKHLRAVAKERDFESYRDSLKDSLKGRSAWNKGLTAESDSRVASYVKKMCESHRQNVSPSSHRNYKGGYYKGIWMRSSWEIAFARWCDSKRIKWLYEIESFDLGYTRYTPDFYLPGKKLYVEVKGNLTESAKKKYSLFKKRYPDKNWVMYTGSMLTQMGVLLK